MAKKKAKWQTGKETKLRKDVADTIRAANKLMLDLKKVQQDMMSKFPSYQGPPYSGPSCPRSSKRRRR